MSFVVLIKNLLVEKFPGFGVRLCSVSFLTDRPQFWGFFSVFLFNFSLLVVFLGEETIEKFPDNLSQSMIRQADRFSMHIAPGAGKGVTNGLPEKTLPV